MRRMLAVIALGLTCATVRAGQIENPEYKEWAKYKPGTSVTIETTSDAGGQNSKTEMKTTLKDVSDDKLTVETTMSMDAGGQKMDLPAQSREVKKMIDDAGTAATPTPQAPANMPRPDVKTSEESVTVGAGTFKAKLTETTMDINGSKSVTKMWTSDEVPGGMLKTESTTAGATTKIELKSFDKK